MKIFDTDIQELKYKVLAEIVRQWSAGTLDEEYKNIPYKIIPGPKPTMRCCIYHERVIVRERVRVAMGGDKNNPSIIEVIDSACDECPVKRFFVTDACRGCLAHKCQNVCPAGAITFEKRKSVIDPDKCIECGRCVKACPYGAIIENQRPCVRSCIPKAITIDKYKKASIHADKCTGCGACVYQCPFGAIADKSYILDVLRMLKDSEKGKKFKVYAVVAPSFAGQFSYAKPGQVVAGIEKVGFYGVKEAALGADAVTKKEAAELLEKGFLTSSCCPAFTDYVRKDFPALAVHISENLSPMAETAKMIKDKDKNARVVFIGPCIAKKLEIQRSDAAAYVDAVLTFEELQALFDGLDVLVEQLPEAPLDEASRFGRGYALSGGVAKAIESVLEKEAPDFKLNAEICNGAAECRTALLKAGKKNYDKNFIEGMFCEAGCIGGAACLTHSVHHAAAVKKHAAQAKKQDIDPLNPSPDDRRRV